MKIGLFTDTYLPVANGICYVIDILRKDLEDAGHEVWVVAPKDIRWRLPKEDRVIRYAAIGGILFRDQFTSFFLIPRQYKKIKKLNLDAIIAFTPTYIGGFGAYCAHKLDIPYVIQYGTDLEGYGELYKKTVIGGMIGAPVLAPLYLNMSSREWLGYVGGFFAKDNKNEPYFSYATRHMLTVLHMRSSAVIATSEKIAAKLRKWPVDQNIHVIPTGVNHLPVSKGFKISFASKYGIKNDDEVILYAGRLSIEKNLNLLVDAFAVLAKKRPKAKLLLVGDFQYRHNLEQQVKSSCLGGKVIFTGQVDRADLGAVYSLGHLFAFPSLTDCQALVLNEAAHAGLPLVWCDDTSLNPVLIDGVSGLQATNDKKDLARKLELVLANKELANKLGKGAKVQAEKYTEKIQTHKLANLLEKTLKRPVN